MPDYPIETHPYILIHTGAYITEEEASRFFPDAVEKRIR